MTHNFSEGALVEMYAQRVLELGRAYVAACEPLKALRLVDDAPSFLDGHPALAAIRDVYIPGPCRLANGSRLHAVNGAVFLPAEWYPKGNQ